MSECLVGMKCMVPGFWALSGLAWGTLKPSPLVSLIAVPSKFLQ
jgi:hypothetical protein